MSKSVDYLSDHAAVKLCYDLLRDFESWAQVEEMRGNHRIGIGDFRRHAYAILMRRAQEIREHLVRQASESEVQR